METCGGVRGCDSLWDFCWRNLQDSVSEKYGVKLAGGAITALLENIPVFSRWRTTSSL